MHQWKKETPFENIFGIPTKERWTHKAPDGTAYYDVVKTYGKPFDVASLKQESFYDFNAVATRVRKSRERLYRKGETQPISTCPVCSSDTQYSTDEVSVYGAPYVRCSTCAHVYVSKRPTAAALERFYRKSTSYASTYVDANLAQRRIEQIAKPKLDWVLDCYKLLHKGCKPEYILDVGAGGGHFVKVCVDNGIDADGLELSNTSRDFALKAFGLNLLDISLDERFTPPRQPDVITLWGLIEHVPNPLDLLVSAHRIVARGGLVVASSPNWNSLSTAVQKACSGNVIRHLDPLGHIHVFSESSLATCFVGAGLAPRAAWTFGMDAFEALCQIGCHMQPNPLDLEQLRDSIAMTQEAIDSSGLSDSIVIAASKNEA